MDYWQWFVGRSEIEARVKSVQPTLLTHHLSIFLLLLYVMLTNEYTRSELLVEAREESVQIVRKVLESLGQTAQGKNDHWPTYIAD